MEIVPVTPPVGAGLTPSEVISVESSGIPAGPIDPPEFIPSGVVTPSGGVAVSGSSTWANAGPAPNRHQAIPAISNGLTRDVKLPRMRRSEVERCDPAAPMSICVATISPGARLSDIVQPLVGSASARSTVLGSLRRIRVAERPSTSNWPALQPLQLNMRLFLKADRGWRVAA